jgi:hypothetical protein
MAEQSTWSLRSGRSNPLTGRVSHRRPERSRMKRLAPIADALVHDARAPLTVIQEYAALMREGLFGPVTNEQQRVLDVIADRAGDLGRVVDNSVDANRIALRAYRSWARPCRLPALVSRSRTTVERKAALRQTQLKFVTGEAAPQIFCDEEAAARAVINIVSAVLNVCGDGCRITVSEETDSDQREAGLRLAVEGPGSELVAALFRDLTEHAAVDGAQRVKRFSEARLSAELILRNLGRIEVRPAEAGRATLWIGFAIADPVEVLRRHLVRLTSHPRRQRHVTLLRAEFEAPVIEQSARDGGGLLTSCLGRDDLAFELDDNRWLVTLARRQADAERFESLVEHRREAVNRRRLGHPLPRISIRLVGSCHSPADISRLLTMIESSPVCAP